MVHPLRFELAKTLPLALCIYSGWNVSPNAGILWCTAFAQALAMHG